MLERRNRDETETFEKRLETGTFKTETTTLAQYYIVRFTTIQYGTVQCGDNDTVHVVLWVSICVKGEPSNDRGIMLMSILASAVLIDEEITC